MPAADRAPDVPSATLAGTSRGRGRRRTGRLRQPGRGGPAGRQAAPRRPGGGRIPDHGDGGGHRKSARGPGGGGRGAGAGRWELRSVLWGPRGHGPGPLRPPGVLPLLYQDAGAVRTTILCRVSRRAAPGASRRRGCSLGTPGRTLVRRRAGRP